jgi:hypothetical protein
MKNRFRYIVLNIILILLINTQASAGEFDHSVFDNLLTQNVNNGLVDYKYISNNINQLQNYLETIENADFNEFKSWSKNEQMAFLINAYNAVTIYGIVQNYPIQYGGIVARARFPKSSIRQIKDFWNKVFVKIAGQDYSLNYIEHEMLRKGYQDPRIHFVIVCASLSCPDLSNRAYLPEKLDVQLDRATKNFINSSKGFVLDKQKNRLYLSAIFGWYKNDFMTDESPGFLKDYGKHKAGILSFIMNYVDENTRNYIKNNNPEIKYMDYDWSLNEQN